MTSWFRRLPCFRIASNTVSVVVQDFTNNGSSLNAAVAPGADVSASTRNVGGGDLRQKSPPVVHRRAEVVRGCFDNALTRMLTTKFKYRRPIVEPRTRRRSVHRSDRRFSVTVAAARSSILLAAAPVIPESELPVLQLNERQIMMLIRSWNGIRDRIVEMGTSMFLGMFQRSPHVREVFEKFRDIDDGSGGADPAGVKDLARNTVLETHGMVVMNAMDEIFSCLDDTTEVVELILEQGRSHARFGDNLTDEVFWAIEEPFLATVHQTLGNQFNSKLEKLYRKTIRFILTTLAIGFREATTQSITNSQRQQQQQANASFRRTPLGVRRSTIRVSFSDTTTTIDAEGNCTANNSMDSSLASVNSFYLSDQRRNPANDNSPRKPDVAATATASSTSGAGSEPRSGGSAKLYAGRSLMAVDGNTLFAPSPLPGQVLE